MFVVADVQDWQLDVFVKLMTQVHIKLDNVGVTLCLGHSTSSGGVVRMWRKASAKDCQESCHSARYGPAPRSHAAVVAEHPHNCGDKPQVVKGC